MGNATTSDLVSDLANLASSAFRALPKKNESQGEVLSSPYFMMIPLPREMQVFSQVSVGLQPLVDRAVQQTFGCFCVCHCCFWLKG